MGTDETEAQGAAASQGGHGHQITIHIDRDVFHTSELALTGAQLRLLPNPPIGEDLDLYLVVRGPGNDIPVSDDYSVTLEEGMRFVTAPRAITPG